VTLAALDDAPSAADSLSRPAARRAKERNRINLWSAAPGIGIGTPSFGNLSLLLNLHEIGEDKRT
jgi:hypothetical protein